MKVRKFPFTLRKEMLPDLFKDMSVKDIVEVSSKNSEIFMNVANGFHVFKERSDLSQFLHDQGAIIPNTNIQNVFGVECPYKKGELLAVRNLGSTMWVLRYFSHITIDGSVACFDTQKKSGTYSNWYHHMSAASLVLPD